MSLLSNDQQQLLHDTIDKYFIDHYSFESRRELARSELGYSTEHWSRFAEFGWLAIPFSEEHGGLGGSVGDVAHLMQTMGQSLALEPFLATVGLAGYLIARGSNDALKESVLAQIIGGESIATLACQERDSNGNLAYVTVTAEAEGEYYRIAGEKVAVINAPQAHYIVVSARTHGGSLDSDGISLFIVDTQSVDLALSAYPTVDGHRAANIRFDTLVSRDSLVAGGQLGYTLLKNATNEGILLSSFEALGAMKTLLEATLRYTSERKQFGVPLATFQVLKHRMADMYMACQCTESLLQESLAKLEHEGAVTAEDMSVLKAQVGQAGRMVADAAIQLHGGMGMTDELNIGHYAKRLLALNALFGNVDFHLKQIWRYLPAS